MSATAKLTEAWASRPELVHLELYMEAQRVRGKVSVHFEGLMLGCVLLFNGASV